MASSTQSSSHIAFCTAVVLSMLSIYFLSTANAAIVVDGNGRREVNITAMLQAATRKGLQARASRQMTCTRGDAVMRLGTEWKERCRQCRCTDSGTQCDGPTCAMSYDLMQEITCAEWTDGGCCCARLGCLLDDGTTIPPGGVVPFDPARPCHRCTCRGANRTSCVIQTCWPYQCVDGVFRQGQCCPDCPNGRTCFLPYRQARQLSRSQLRSLQPVRQSSPLTLRAGAPTEVTCTCESGMVAKCSPKWSSERGLPVARRRGTPVAL